MSKKIPTSMEDYSEARIREFDETNRIPDALEKRVRERIGGNYTMEREQLFQGMSVKDIADEIKEQRAAQATPSP